MSEWYDLMMDIRTLRDRLNDAPMDTPALQKALYTTVSLLHRMLLDMELQRNSASLRASRDDLDTATLTLRLNDLEADMRLGFRNVLAAIEKTLPEPPRSFDE